MASVQDLIALADHETRVRNPGASAFQNVLRGFQQGQGAGSSLDRVKTLIALDENRKMMERRAEEDRKSKAMISKQQEDALKAGMKSVGGKGQPLVPAQKLDVTISPDAEGFQRRSIKIVDSGPGTEGYTAKNYVDAQGKERIGKWDKSKGLITDPNDPISRTMPAVQTTAQKVIDREFGKEYNRYVSSGGYADTMSQISNLDDVLGQLEKNKRNLTGPGLSMLPDEVRKRLSPKSFAAQQAVEMSVQRTLKQTLGGQFTEKEGLLFMQRGYDPALPEAANAKKLKMAISTLKMMALAKQNAIDYYDENQTLDGFVGTFYTLKDGVPVEASKGDFYKQMGVNGPSAEKTAQETGKKNAELRFNEIVESGKSEDEAYKILAGEGY